MADNRAKITRSAIKDGMLDLLVKTPFQYVTVASLCREAGVGRATFYTHYTGLMDVINELADEAISATRRSPMDNHEAIAVLAERVSANSDPRALEAWLDLMPMCQRVADHPKYRSLFKDDFLSEYIIMRIFRKERAASVDSICRQCGLSEEVAEKVFLFSVMGLFAVNRSLGWKKDDAWYEAQRALLVYMAGGVEALKKLK